MERKTVWVLVMNDMRSANVERCEVVCWSEHREILIALLATESVEPWTDGRWGKSYRRGGPLEWMNPPYQGCGQGVLSADVAVEYDETLYLLQPFPPAPPASNLVLAAELNRREVEAREALPASVADAEAELDRMG